ncbi:MAG TPA: sigma-70 family RNA polymerase sigma factor [Blastocatellia bacterium]|nr:sigma-70 family RNA polymerase sigma factor [Blastocatellia bacterium]
MTPPSSQGITQLLLAWSDGDQAALEKLTPLVYAELHRLAKGYMLGERPGHTLQTTALINEAYLRLTDWKNVRWQSRAHFFGVAAQLMRRILVDFARSRHYTKRGRGAQQVSLDEAITIHEDLSAELIALDDALKSLAKIDPRKSQVVELRFFGGLSAEEMAEALKVSKRTVEREWNLARAWLYRELRGNDES